YTEPEPHFAQILKVSEIKPIEVYPKDENKNPNAIWDMAQAGVTRSGTETTAKVIAVRSRLVPDRIDAQVGDTLTVHVTNIEQTGDMIHGFGINEHNVNIVMDPGETKTLKVTLKKPGVFAYYCTNFCSALHQEMQGYLIVRPAGAATPSAPPPPATGTSPSAPPPPPATAPAPNAPATPATTTPVAPPPAPSQTTPAPSPQPPAPPASPAPAPSTQAGA
ncbi:MAG TPA: cupredoxin domain-containing protein, partial [Chthoniobacteraceae bacterium]|nr:cupredoxin domain-containing protein [Chthoniobacteraceae bacterium]